MLFFSEEYIKYALDKCNNDEPLKNFFRNNIIFTIKAEPEGTINKNYVVGFMWEQDHFDAWYGEKPSDYTFIAKYGVWVETISLNRDVVRSYFDKKIIVIVKSPNSINKLVSFYQPLIRFIYILKTVPTEFEDKYYVYNIK